LWPWDLYKIVLRWDEECLYKNDFACQPACKYVQ
jgi:hypothetical protein